MAAIFQNQDSVADRWRDQIAAVRREREALKKQGGTSAQVGALTRRIRDMEKHLAKLMQQGASHEY